MQDTSTGEMKPIDPRFFEGMEKLKPGEITKYLAQNQEAKDSTIPNRAHQGPIFAVGEILEIKGGRFKVHAIAGNRLYLDGVPSK